MAQASVPQPVPLFDATYQAKLIWEPLVAAVSDVLRSGRYVLGKQVAGFERALARLAESDYAIGVASGTDALFFALAGAGIGPGDEVITTPFTFIATVEAIIRTGARPVFADVRADTLNLDAMCVESAITERTAAVVLVHLFGQPCDLDAFSRLTASHKVLLIEDSAQALGARWRGRPVGTFGDASALSFFPTKTLGAAGDGGAVLTNRAGIDAKVRQLRSHGAQGKYVHEFLGTNSRLDELQAAILNVKLPYLDEWNRERRRIAQGYSDGLAGTACEPLNEDERAEGVFSQYTVRVVAGRNALLAFLGEQQIGCAVHYPTPLHLQPALAALGYRLGDFPVAEAACHQVLSLPCYPGLGSAELARVVAAVTDWPRLAA